MVQTNELATTSKDIYARITDHIVGALQAHQKTGRPWLVGNQLPVNAVTRKPYRGINVLALWAAADAAGYRSQRWGTFEQWRQLGTPVQKGQKATTIVFWRECGIRDDETDDENRPRSQFVARGYSVFNVAQTHHEGTPEVEPADKFARAQALLGALGADIRHGGDVAYYSVTTDHIQMPHLRHYPNAVSYYGILTHEFTHWTGAPSRLARDLANRFGCAAYAMEELVAELGSAFLCAMVGLEATPRADHARYIGSWLEVLGRDTRAVFTAASRAQAAADWLWARAKMPPVGIG